VRARPTIIVSETRVTRAVSAHHRRPTVGRNFSAFGSDGISTLVDRKITSDSPLGPTDTLSGLIELGRHIQVVNRGLTTVNGIKDNKRVDLKVRKVEINIDRIETNQKISEGILLLSRDMTEEGSSNNLASGEGFVDRDIKDEGFGVNVTNVNTTLMSEEYAITLALRTDTNIILSIGRVGEERLDNEIVQSARDSFNLLSGASEKKKNEAKCSVCITKLDVCITFCGFPARSETHCLASGQLLLRARSPALPRRLMS